MFKIIKDMESKEESIKRRIMLADIKENVWKRRCTQSIHEEHSDMMESESKKVNRGKVRDRIQKLEELKKTAEEIEGRKQFMLNWKEKENRKGKKEVV